MPRLFRFRPAFVALLLLVSFASAQSNPFRLVVLPFDAEASVGAFGLAFPTALQRAFNEIDNVYAPPVGDAGVILQRVSALEQDAIAAVRRVFAADALVLARITGSDNLQVELLVIDAAGVENGTVLQGRVGDLSTLWKAMADAVLERTRLTVSNNDRASLRRVLDDAPSIPSLGPLGVAGARIPGVRVDQLEAAASLDPASGWVRVELARARAISGDLDGALRDAQAAVSANASVEHLTQLGVVQFTAGNSGAAASFAAALNLNPAHAVALVGLAQTNPTNPESAALLERAVAAAPRQVEAHVALAELQSTPARVVQLLRRAAASLPDSVSIGAALVDTTLAAGDPRGALSLLQSMVADPVGRRPAIYALAARLPNEIAGDALALVRAGRVVYPLDEDLRRTEIALLRQTGDATAADSALRAWVESGTAPVGDVMAWAQTLAIAGRTAEAQAVVDALGNADGDAAVRGAQVALAAGRSRDALALLEPSVRAGTADALARAFYGVALGRTGNIDGARQILTEVVAQAQNATTLREFEAGDLAARALAALNEQQAIAGPRGIALNAEASVAFEQGLFALENNDLLGAGAAFARARSLQNVGILAFYEGYALQMLGQPRAAIAAYQAAIEDLGPNDTVWNNLGYAQLQVGRLDLALEAINQALSINPANARALLNLGLTYYGLSRYRDAVTAFDRALALEPGLYEGAAPLIDDARRRLNP